MGLEPDYLGVYLKALTPFRFTKCLINFQIWVAHQEDSEKDVQKGTKLASGLMIVIVVCFSKTETLLLFTEAYGIQLTETVDARGFSTLLSSYQTALDYMAGFVKDGHMT